MKLTGDVIEVSTNGDSLTVAVQCQIGRAGWMPIEKQTLRIADTQQNRKAFHVGRQVTIELKAKK